MKAVEITAKEEKNRAQNDLALVSARGFSVEETQRYAGSFDDPGRMAQSYAGVAAGDDGSNELVVRGNSPRGVLWKMEGMEIPNPNHFSEQGSGGGAISMLKGGMMANSDFYTGAFPAEYGNAASGVFDINLRKGNNQKREYAAQIGLLGVEGAMEGPFKAGYEGSYLVNYRYSTLDMLRAIGIDVVGDQVPVFQDLAYNINLPTKKAGNFTLFGLGGISYVNEKWDGGEQYFQTNMGVSGFTHKLLLGKKTLWSTTGGFTGNKNNYFSVVYDSSEARTVEDWNETFISKNFRISSNLNYKHSALHSFKTGIIYSNLGFDMQSTHYDFENKKEITDLDADGRTGMMQGFVNWKYRLGEKWTMNSGLHYLHYLLNDQNSLEPRLALQWQAKPKHTFSAGFGIHSRVEDPSVYLAQAQDDLGKNFQPNRNLATWKARHYVLGYDYMITSDIHLKAEVYYQQLYDVPVMNDSSSNFSSINTFNGYTADQLVNNGTGTNYGIDVTLERYFSEDFYFMYTASVFESKYVGGDGVERNTRFNRNYTFNYLFGKEFKIGDSEKANKLGLSFKVLHMGGNRQWSLLLDESRAAGESVWDNANPFVERAPDYFRGDFTISYRRNKKNTTRIWKLDVQNVTNHQNVYQQFYNPESDQVDGYTMMGLLPILSYRIEF